MPPDTSSPQMWEVLAETVTKNDADKEGTWTFYRIRTTKGDVTIRWSGTSNGWYSEEVTCEWHGTANAESVKLAQENKSLHSL